MSNPDSFIEEVTEEVRRDRLFAVLRRYGWIAVVVVVAIVGGAAFNEWNKAKARAAAQAQGDAILAALEAPDAAARVAALGDVATDGDVAALTGLLAAGELIAEESDADAIAALTAIAENPALAQVYRDLASLKLVLAEGASASVDDRRATLDQLAVVGRPFRALALEQLALLDVEAGNAEAAIDRLNEILQLDTATPALRQRASQLIVALGGEPQGS